jgi:hypothetical protein
VSGGFAGLALVLVGAGLASVQAGRRLAAAERADTEAVIEEAVGILEALDRRTGRSS